jgi:homoserine O-acetyltransferase
LGLQVTISATAKTHPTTIALRYAQRCILMNDPDWCNGNYYAAGKFPAQGLKLARMV